MRDHLSKFRRRGCVPHRVLTDGAGTMAQQGEYDIVFIRDDGWSLGAPSELAPAAADLYPKRWRHVWYPGPNGGQVQSFADYIEAQDEADAVDTIIAEGFAAEAAAAVDEVEDLPMESRKRKRKTTRE